ncbi:MAG: MmgE/PrpD family protein [Proteobacteria bacterium]|nr:MmgE/PrpD family protein [Pseudomonadota bacterium]
MSDIATAAAARDGHAAHAPATGTGLAAAFATRVAALHFDDLPPAAVHWAKVGILDTIGVTLAGSREEGTRLVARALDLAPGASLLWGSARRTGALDAAMVNGTASHALDFDDCNNTLGGHPSAPVLSALFPLADELHASGREFINAYVAGFEVETKLALAVNFHHYTKGWHPTATLGTFGAAAACARLMDLDAQQTAVAISLAASFAAGIKANFGTMAKPMHVGHSARNGLLAARLAREGFTANTVNVFEHDQGFLNVFNGPGNYDAARALAAWAAPLDIVAPGIAIKQYPCCGSTHPAIDAMLAIVERRKLAPDDIARIDAWIHARRLKHTNRPDPNSPLDAKFSLQYVLARALADGHVGVADFEGDAYLDPRVRALLPRVHVAPYDDSQFAADNHFGGSVRVTLKDGSVETARVESALGRTSANPVPEDRLRQKFTLCATTVLRAEAADAIATAVARLDTMDDMRALTDLAAAGAMEQGRLN